MIWISKVKDAYMITGKNVDGTISSSGAKKIIRGMIMLRLVTGDLAVRARL